MNQWITLLQGALAGGAIGAFVSPVIAQRSDRRTSRAKAREKLAEAEDARRDPAAAFSEILIQLRTVAMIAGVPRSVVEKYISVAQNYRKLGLDQNTGKSAPLDRSKPQNWSGFLNMDAVMAASMLSKVLWHPWAGRVLVGVKASPKAVDLAKAHDVDACKGHDTRRPQDWKNVVRRRGCSLMLLRRAPTTPLAQMEQWPTISSTPEAAREIEC